MRLVPAPPRFLSCLTLLPQPDSLQVPYCQTAPKNAELNGLFHCQFASSDFTKFSGDQTGNLPLGVSAVTPPGSCPAKTDGPVPDGVQLNTLVTDPGVPAAGGAAAASAPAAASSAAADDAAAAATAAAATAAAATAAAAATTAAAAVSTAAAAVATVAAAPAAAAADAKPFTLQNGKDAQALNAQFASLTASSSCTNGQQACVQGGFAQCVGSTFQITQCAGGTQCFALPLVNSAGTSITCSTEADATARIAATGATGGLTGSA
jgi:hypothetical protein